MVRSRARGVAEDLAFVMGSGVYRCGSCGGRFLCFHRFSIPSSAHDNYVGKHSSDEGYMFAWFAIFAGFLTCLGIAFFTLRKFHRWPF